MTSTEILLLAIWTQLLTIWVYLRWIYLRLEYPQDYQKPVNSYGENLTDAIQNSIVRGQRGISTYE